MTNAGWVERIMTTVVEQLGCDCATCMWPVYRKLLEAEHARAVRIVKAKLKAAQYAVEDSGSAVDLAYWGGQEAACKDILTALQRGRGGKG